MTEIPGGLELSEFVYGWLHATRWTRTKVLWQIFLFMPNWKTAWIFTKYLLSVLVNL